jgi:hypothetical protein
MTDTFRAEYVVLSHRPSVNRTEHLHYGILTRSPHGWRAHVAHDLRKLRAIDPQASADALRDLESRIPQLLHGCQSWEQARLALRAFGIHASEGNHGMIAYASEQDYLRGVQAALASQVLPPARQRPPREATSRLHLDLKRSFAARGWMGRDIWAHQIVERYQLAGQMVTAEFALRNGRLHVLETVDLRTSNPAAKRADVRAKALVMDYAADTEPDSARYAIIAGIDSPVAAEAKTLLQRYATHVLAWESRADMDALMQALATATGKPDLLPPATPA